MSKLFLGKKKNDEVRVFLENPPERLVNEGRVLSEEDVAARAEELHFFPPNLRRYQRSEGRARLRRLEAHPHRP